MRKMDKWPNQSMIVLLNICLKMVRPSFMVIVVYIFSWNLRENSSAAKWQKTWLKN